MKLFYPPVSYPCFLVENLPLGRNSETASSELNVGFCPQGVSRSRLKSLSVKTYTLRSLGVIPKDNLFAEKQKGFLVCSVHNCILSVQSNAGQKSVLEESVD